MKKDLHFIFLLVILLLAFSVFINFSNANSYDIESKNKIILSQDSNIEIITYMDFNCENCKKTYFKMMNDLDKYKNFISMKLKHGLISTDNINQALGIECANDQNNLINYLSALKKSKNQNPVDIAKILELNIPKFKTCMNQQNKKELILTESNELESLNSDSIPTIIINNKQIKTFDVEKEILKLIS